MVIRFIKYVVPFLGRQTVDTALLPSMQGYDKQRAESFIRLIPEQAQGEVKKVIEQYNSKEVIGHASAWVFSWDLFNIWISWGVTTGVGVYMKKDD